MRRMLSVRSQAQVPLLPPWGYEEVECDLQPVCFRTPKMKLEEGGWCDREQRIQKTGRNAATHIRHTIPILLLTATPWAPFPHFGLENVSRFYHVADSSTAKRGQSWVSKSSRFGQRPRIPAKQVPYDGTNPNPAVLNAG